jgi:beta-mannanase
LALPEQTADVLLHLAAGRSTRRQAGAGLLAAAATSLVESVAGAKKKRKHHKKSHHKHGHPAGSGGSTIDKPAHVALGAFVPKALDDTGVYNDFTDAIGRDPDFLVWYEDWANGNFGKDHRAYLDTFDQHDLSVVIDWEPYDADGPTIDQPSYSLATITGGDHNSYIDSWASGLAAYGKPVFMKFAHEMNGGWFPWGVGVNGNEVGDFIDAWRHIYNRFANKGADNVRWVWVPNKVYDTIPATFAEVYPGDDYVDWIGMNGYNWGTAVYWESCPCRSKWESFSEVFDETYDDLVAFADKPIMVGECAASEKGGNKAHWITDGLVDVLPEKYPNVRAFTWFHTKATGLDTNKHGEVVPTAEVDWRITSSDEARKAFRNAVKNDFYNDSLRSIT